MDTNSDQNAIDHLQKAKDLLQQFHHERLLSYIPIIVILSVLAIMGIVGNCFTIRYYSAQRRKSSTATFIQYLGGIDLVVCVIAFASLGNLAANVYLSSGVLCKLLYFSTHLFVVGSVMVLWIISIDRYLKVCRPLGKQISQSLAKWFVLGLMTLSSVFSVSQLFMYDAVRVALDVTSHNTSDSSTNGNQLAHDINTSIMKDGDAVARSRNSSSFTIIGHYCTITDDADQQIIVKIANAIDAVIIAVTLITFLVTYSSMLVYISTNTTRRTTYVLKDPKKTTHKGKRETKTPQHLYREATLSRHSQSTPDINHDTPNDDMDGNTGVTPDRIGTRSMDDLTTPRYVYKTLKRGPTKTSTEANFTAMMAVVSAALVVCFIPYFIIAAIRTLTETSGSEFGVIYQLALRSPFLNSIVNPIIFCVFNPRYRRFIRNGFVFDENIEGLHSLTFVSRRARNPA